ncbi:hypothetical protein DSJ_02990 [Pantoea stewartii subsp. stewartii DC283]|uniref:Uncharacterized protein n=1 Tax=Pantoea stewartii subsp. stewartii DC283 TaxID=660596 RepID=A0ABM6K0Z8_PANSE|nr:hypothetical protein DSJ_02990 [Pantoea stewartii subsp. stewartii DC283]
METIFVLITINANAGALVRPALRLRNPPGLTGCGGTRWNETCGGNLRCGQARQGEADILVILPAAMLRWRKASAIGWKIMRL